MSGRAPFPDRRLGDLMDGWAERAPDGAGSTDPVGVLSDFSHRVRDGASIGDLAADAVKAATGLYSATGSLVLEIRGGELAPLAVRGFDGPVHAVFVDPM